MPSGRDKRKMGGLHYTMLQHPCSHFCAGWSMYLFKAAKKGLQDLESVSVFQVCHHQWGDYFICHCAPLQLHTTETKNAQAGQVPLCTKNMQQFQMIKAPLKQLSKRHSIAKLNKKNVIKKSSPGSMRAKSAFTFRGHHINK